jgi:hypothetical protein
MSKLFIVYLLFGKKFFAFIIVSSQFADGAVVVVVDDVARNEDAPVFQNHNEPSNELESKLSDENG